MLTTTARTTQSLTSLLARTTGVARPAGMTCVRHRSVTAATYQNLTTRSFATATGAIAGTTSFDASWSFIERKPMPKVDLHPDRWPLQSTS